MPDRQPLSWDMSRDETHTHSVCDEQVRYYIAAPSGMGLQEIADEFLSGYAVPDDDNGSDVKFQIEDVEGQDVLGCYRGLPNEPAREI